MSSVRPRCVSVVFNWCSVTLLEGSSVINVFSRVAIQPHCLAGLTCFSWRADMISRALISEVTLSGGFCWFKFLNVDFCSRNCISNPNSVCLSRNVFFSLFLSSVLWMCVCVCLQRRHTCAQVCWTSHRELINNNDTPVCPHLQLFNQCLAQPLLRVFARLRTVGLPVIADHKVLKAVWSFSVHFAAQLQEPDGWSSGSF